MFLEMVQPALARAGVIVEIFTIFNGFAEVHNTCHGMLFYVEARWFELCYCLLGNTIINSIVGHKDSQTG
jgi:hypothetical protein